MRRRAGFVGAVAFVSVMALGDVPVSGATDAKARVRRAPAALLETGTCRIESTTSGEGGSFEQGGLLDFDEKDGDLWFDPWPLTGTRVSARIIDGEHLYVEATAFPDETLPPGYDHERWIGISGDEALGQSLGYVGLLYGTLDARRLRREHLGAVPTTLYSVTFDLDVALERAPRSQRIELQDIASTVRDARLTNLRVWLDNAGRPVRVAARLVVDGNVADVVTEFVNFGVPVHVVEPLPESVYFVDGSLVGEPV